MSLSNPYGTPKPCVGCEHWGGDLADGSVCKCLRDRVQIQANPDAGCVYWVRAIGADDEPDQMRGSRAENKFRVT
jgi:hypothetical protein